MCTVYTPSYSFIYICEIYLVTIASSYQLVSIVCSPVLASLYYTCSVLPVTGVLAIIDKDE